MIKDPTVPLRFLTDYPRRTLGVGPRLSCRGSRVWRLPVATVIEKLEDLRSWLCCRERRAKAPLSVWHHSGKSEGDSYEMERIRSLSTDLQPPAIRLHEHEEDSTRDGYWPAGLRATETG